MPHLSVSRLFLPGVFVLILNSAHLVAAPTASLWYYASVVAHPLIGIALALAVHRFGLRGQSICSPRRW